MKISARSALLLALPAMANGSPNSLRALKKDQVQVQVQGSTRENNRGIEYPAFRFTPWCSLDEKAQQQAADLSCK